MHVCRGHVLEPVVGNGNKIAGLSVLLVESVMVGYFIRVKWTCNSYGVTRAGRVL